MKESEAEIKGQLATYSEQGIGPIWIIKRDEPLKGEQAEVTLCNGDLLTVFADAAAKIVRWSGTVDLDATVHFVDLKVICECGPQTTRRVYSSNGFQRGMAKEWIDMFLWGLHAKVTPANKRVPQPL